MPDEELEAIGFDTSPTGRFGIAAVSERIRPAMPVRAHGTPPPQITRPIPPATRAPAPARVLARVPASTPPGPFAPMPAAAPALDPAPASGPPTTLAPPLPPAPETAAGRLPLPIPAPPVLAPAGAPTPALTPAMAPAGSPARSPRSSLLPAPASRSSSFANEVPTIPESLWSGASSLFDGTTFDKTPFPADLIPADLIEEDAPLDRDAAERGMLAAIAAGDETSRLIYADWLEDRDEHARAGFLRIEQLVSRLLPDDPRYAACTRQLRELVQHVDADWRARVARPPIEGCPSSEPRCPRRWAALARTEREAVRHCGPCAKHVYYFETVDEAREAARRGACVAIDLGAERWENDLVDLGVRCDGCARRVVSTARYCPHCGDSLRKSEELEVRVIDVDG